MVDGFMNHEQHKKGNYDRHENNTRNPTMTETQTAIIATASSAILTHPRLARIMTRTQIEERKYYIDQLRACLSDNETVYTILGRVSRSGMQRHVRIVLKRDAYFLHPNYHVATALGIRLTGENGQPWLVMKGCGKDMGLHLVEQLRAATGCRLEHQWI